MKYRLTLPNTHIYSYNMNMATTVTTSTSWLSRLGSSVKNVFFGFILVIGSVFLLFWNEGRAIKTYQSLKEGASLVVSISPDSRKSEHEGKLIHFSGDAKTPSVLTDVDFGVAVNALKLNRIVEVFQWEEDSQSTTKEKFGGGTDTTTTYTYSKKWSDTLIDSSSFQEKELHQNPSTKRFENKEWFAENVSVGSYSIPNALLASLTGYVPFTITQEMLSSLPYGTQEKLELEGNMIYYQTEKNSDPSIGDTRIKYEYIAPQKLSVISQQSGDSLVPFESKNSRTISMIQLGNHTAKEMFDTAISSNVTVTWIIRAAGTLVMYIGLSLIFGVLPVVASVIPLFGRLVGAGISLIAGLLTLIGATVTVGIAWIFYRPMIGIVLFLIAAVGIYMFIKSMSRKPAIK